VDVGQDTTLCDGDVSKQLVQLLIVSDGELEMSGDDTGLLVVTGSVTGQLENLGSEVLEDGGKVDGSTGTDTLSVVALAEQTVDTTNREGETSLAGTAIEEDGSANDSNITRRSGYNSIRNGRRSQDGLEARPY
jgi:hypothetical protein